MLDRKVNDETCDNCPYARFSQDYDDYIEWCEVTHSEMELRWYCVMPSFIKKIARKWYEYKEIKAMQKYYNEEVKGEEE